MLTSTGNRFSAPAAKTPAAWKQKKNYKKHKDLLFFLMNPDGIAAYLTGIFNYWLIRVEYAGKSNCNSWYIKLVLGTVTEPKTIHIRISDHDAASEDSRYDYDVICSFQRAGSHGIIPVTYIRLIERLAEKFGKDIPPLCKALLPFCKQHAIALQRRRKSRKRLSRGSRLFVA